MKNVARSPFYIASSKQYYLRVPWDSVLAVHLLQSWTHAILQGLPARESCVHAGVTVAPIHIINHHGSGHHDVATEMEPGTAAVPDEHSASPGEGATSTSASEAIK